MDRSLSTINREIYSNNLVIVNSTANSTREYLQGNGFDVTVEHRGDTAIDRIQNEKPDLVILDIMLPGADGMEVCRRVRPVFSAPILMLTARDDSVDQIVGLEIGADDYVIKPVVPRVLLARIRAMLRNERRTSESTNKDMQPCVSTGTLSIDYNHRIVTWQNKTVQCTEVEFELLWLLATHAGQILSRDFLYRVLNGHEYDGLDRSIDIRISRLRKKFEDDLANPVRIKMELNR